MGLIVQKFGGSSVADATHPQRGPHHNRRPTGRGHRVVAVLSAQGDTTDDLIAKPRRSTPTPPAGDGYAAVHRRADLLLPVRHGHRGHGLPGGLPDGLAGGFRTNSSYGDARIKRIDTERVLAELDKNTIVIVTGFQGLNKYEDITTLGRGGSDTSAVALAAVLHADLCQIYTDVDGVYTADPRHVKGARKLEEITYDEMLELATLAQVLHNRSVEMAKRYGVNLEVLSSFSGKPGTKVKEVAKTMEKLHVSGVACDKNVARVAVVGLADEPGIAFKIFSLLAKERINVDLILQSIGRNNTKDISFTVSIQDVERCKQLLDEHRDFLQFDHVDVNDKIAKVSIVGAGMVHNPGVAAKMFEALYNAGINISMISTSEIKVSVLVDINEADRAVQVIHDRFFHEFGGN